MSLKLQQLQYYPLGEDPTDLNIRFLDWAGHVEWDTKLTLDLLEKASYFGIANNLDKNIKPYLFPISLIDEEITFVDQTFVPTERLPIECNQWCDAYQEYLDIALDDREALQDRILQAPFELFEKLLQWHFDVFGLIPEGLAIKKQGGAS